MIMSDSTVGKTVISGREQDIIEEFMNIAMALEISLEEDAGADKARVVIDKAIKVAREHKDSIREESENKEEKLINDIVGIIRKILNNN